MPAIYDLFKASLDPVVFILILIAFGILISFKSKKKHSIKIVLLAVFSILYIASIFPVSNALSYVLEKKYLLKNNDDVNKLDIVVVLGGGVTDNKYLKETMLSKESASRLLYAVEVFRRSGAKYLVCAGKGKGKRSEGEVMGVAAERLGIPPAQIKIDPESENTWEHAEELDKMFQDKSIMVGVVTSAYHMERSEREFRKYFPGVTPLPSGYLYSLSPPLIIAFLPRSDNFYKFSTALHEMIGIIWYRIKK